MALILLLDWWLAGVWPVKLIFERTAWFPSDSFNESWLPIYRSSRSRVSSKLIEVINRNFMPNISNGVGESNVEITFSRFSLALFIFFYLFLTK